MLWTGSSNTHWTSISGRASSLGNGNAPKTLFVGNAMSKVPRGRTTVRNAGLVISRLTHALHKGSNQHAAGGGPGWRTR